MPTGLTHTGPAPAGRIAPVAGNHGIPRPIYREPATARSGAVFAGAVAAAFWMLIFGVLAGTARAYAWWTIVAGTAAWAASFVLARRGDRGVATGVALSAGVGVGIAFSVVMAHWIGGHWILW